MNGNLLYNRANEKLFRLKKRTMYFSISSTCLIDQYIYNIVAILIICIINNIFFDNNQNSNMIIGKITNGTRKKTILG